MTIRELESLYANLTPENGNDFIKSIRLADKSPEINSLTLIGRLENMVEKFRQDAKRICAASDNMMMQEDRDLLTLYGRIVAALMLVLHKTSSFDGLRNYSLLFLEYASAVVRIKYDYLTTALDVITYRISALGIDWHVVQDATSLDFLSYKLLEGIKFDKSHSNAFVYKGKGQILCQGGVLSVCSSEAMESGSKAFSVCGERVGVYTRNVRDEKLKSSEQYNASVLRSFAETFLRIQEDGSKRGNDAREYKNGDIVDIQVLSYSPNGNSLNCRVVNDDTDFHGIIIDEELLKGVWTSDIINFFYEKDCIRGAVIYKSEKGNQFSIKEAYTAFARKVAEQDFRDNVFFQARVYDVNQESGKVYWMTPLGYGGITNLDDTPVVNKGDVMILQVRNIQKIGQNTYINLCLPKYEVGTVRPFPEDDDDLLGSFITTEPSILRSREAEKSVKTDKGKDTVKALSSILSSTVSRGSSIDAYRHLLVALFLSEVIDDGDSVKRLRAKAYYLGQCLAFAQGECITPVKDITLPEREASVIALLSSWQEPDGDFCEQLLRLTMDSIPGVVASLLFSLRMSERFKDEIKADKESIRKRICDVLGVGDSFEFERVARGGKYGKAENHEVEFKSSYVFRNDKKVPEADIEYQGKGQVFEAVCAFLNADGGVIYIGVNNDGDPIVACDSGINADIAWLSDNYTLINNNRRRSLGHPVAKADNLDHFALFLNDEKELYFKDSLQGNIIIEVTEDADAIRITVKPAEYEIAYLYSDKSYSDGVAYVRDGGRTVPMSRVQKEQRLASLKRITKEMGFVVTIQEAIDKHRRLIFKDYASGNSGEVKDRYVVPINLFYNDENVYCYDLVSRKYKQFRLHRISSIESSEDSSPYTLPVQNPKQADVFRWILSDGQRPYHIRLRMDVGAKNYLMEEYSCAEKLSKEEFYEEKKNKWILDTYVNGLGAVRRFYLGLADKIEILETEDSEEIKKCIAEYIKTHIDTPS